MLGVAAAGRARPSRSAFRVHTTVHPYEAILTDTASCRGSPHSFPTCPKLHFRSGQTSGGSRSPLIGTGALDWQAEETPHYEIQEVTYR